MRHNVGFNFWTKVKTFSEQVDADNRERMSSINSALGLKENKRFQKHVSYLGAVRAPGHAAGQDISYICPYTAVMYTDVGNWVYKEVFFQAWPEAREVYSDPETVGDIVEFVLGWYYCMTVQRGIVFAGIAVDFIEILEAALWVRLEFERNQAGAAPP